jgi:transcriptional regulator with XRE-family HTH domain
MKYRLRAILERYGQTQNDLAEVLGISYQTISMKVNGKKDFTQSEIYTIIYMYKLTKDEVIEIFFNPSDRLN